MDCNRVSRNDPCLCGSGKKYKHCCLPKEVAARQTIRRGNKQTTTTILMKN